MLVVPVCKENLTKAFLTILTGHSLLFDFFTENIKNGEYD